MIKSWWVTLAGASMLSIAAGCVVSAQTPSAETSFPLYCRGPLNTLRTDGGKLIKTSFKWAKEAAIKERPGAGQCAWADSTPQGFDSKPGADGVLVGNLGPFDTLPVGTVAKVCVTKASTASGQGSDLMVRQVLRQLGHQTSPYHIPPFSAEGCTS